MALNRITSSKIIIYLAIFLILSILLNTELSYRICAIALFLGGIALGKKEPNFLNPYYLFSLCPLTLAVYVSLTDVYMMELNEKTWLLCVLNIYAFMFALYKTKPFINKNNCIGVTNKASLHKHAIICFILSFVGDVIEPLSAVMWIFSIPAIVCSIKSKDKIMYGVVLLYFGLSIVSGMASKLGLLMNVLTIIISYIKYFNWRRHKERLIFLGGAGALLMFLSFSVIGIKGRERNRDQVNVVSQYERSGGFEWNYATALFLPYMYLETPWSNVEYVMETQDTRTYGLWMAKPILGYIGLKDRFGKEYELDAKSSFNTFTFITVGFKDFGLWLSVIPTLFLGFFVKKVYSRYLISRSPYDVACWATVAVATFQMYFSNHFYMQSYPFTCFIVLEMYKRIAMAMGDKVIEVEKI